eukprot:g12318.t1
MAPMPNPEWYQEKEHTRVSLKNLRKLPLSEHVEVWSSSWRWYKGSFEESFAWSRKRKEEAKKKEAQEKLDALQGMIRDAREATHNTPEDLEKSKQALKELLEEMHANRDGLKSAAKEKLDLIRLSLAEFSSGYREARDEEIKRVMAMDESVLKSFLSERADEVKHATSIISDAILDKDQDQDKGGSPRSIGSSSASQQLPAGGAGQEPPAEGTPAVNPGTDPGGERPGGPGRFLSQRTRQAVDDVLRDPDIERLAGRAKGFARERVLQAEAAARVLKERGAGEGQGKEGGGVKYKASAKGGEHRGGGDSETPIISGLVSEASEFVAGRVGEAREGVREVVGAAVDVRRSRRKAAAAAAVATAAERSEKDEAESGGGDAAGGAGKAGEGGNKGGTR